MSELVQTKDNVLGRYKEAMPVESASKPYTMGALPDRVKKMPKHAQEIWLAAFNASYSKYGEGRAFAIANSAVSAKYEQVDGRWRKKKD